MSIFSIFNKKNKDKNEEKEIVKYDNISFLDLVGKEELISVSTCKDYDNKKLKKIGAGTRLNMLLQQLPLVSNVMQQDALDGAYKIVFSDGAIGKLMEYKDGTLGTPLVGSNNKISGHAGLVPIEKSSLLSPVMFFSAMSVVTGQYFMSNINNSLLNISKDLEEVIDLFFDEKESDMKAIYDFYEQINKNINTIMNNKELKAAYLTNVLSNNSKLDSNMKLYRKCISRELKKLNSVMKYKTFTSDRLEEVKKINNKINDLMNQQGACFEVFCIGKMMEVKLAEIYEEQYYNNIIDQFKDLNVEMQLDIDNLTKCCKKVLSEIRNSAILHKEDSESQLSKCNENLKARRALLSSRIDNFVGNINNLLIESKKEKEFYVIGNDLYLKIEG